MLLIRPDDFNDVLKCRGRGAVAVGVVRAFRFVWCRDVESIRARGGGVRSFPEANAGSDQCNAVKMRAVAGENKIRVR